MVRSCMSVIRRARRSHNETTRRTIISWTSWTSRPIYSSALARSLALLVFYAPLHHPMSSSMQGAFSSRLLHCPLRHVWCCASRTWSVKTRRQYDVRNYWSVIGCCVWATACRVFVWQGSSSMTTPIVIVIGALFAVAAVLDMFDLLWGGCNGRSAYRRLNSRALDMCRLPAAWHDHWLMQPLNWVWMCPALLHAREGEQPRPSWRR